MQLYKSQAYHSFLPSLLGILLFAFLTSATTLCSVHSAVAAWKPTKTVKIIVPAREGGALDRLARLVQEIMQKEGLIKKKVTLLNKKGGGHRKALAFLSKKKGDAHFLEIESPTMFGKNIVGKSPYSYDSVTPIAMLYEEYMALAVPLNSKLKSANEIVRILKKDPTALSLGISGSPGSGTHISIAMPLKALGIDITKLRTVVFGGGKQLVVAIIGGHVDYGGSGLTNLGKSMKDGKLRLLAHTGTVRLKGYLKSVPPWKDLGANIKFSVWRAVVGPLGLSKDQIAFLGWCYCQSHQEQKMEESGEKAWLPNDF